jgi:hypothetical protein
MNFKIRHQISDLEEEIYSFNVLGDSITYNSFESSKRKNVNDPFGYDWHKFYANVKQSELNALEKEFGEDIHNWYHPENYRLEEVDDRYNPVMHGLLSGLSASNLVKKHPLKISPDDVKNALIEKIKKMEVR